jgi:23S rRNA (cytidine1920-2'-O)/16S rRNA (cytidine1409-2'-O)-methyltransferase
MTSPKKERLDKLLLLRNMVSSREKAQALILAGEVLVDDVPITKAGSPVNVDANIRLRTMPSKYVSRGGDKLEGALQDFSLDPKDRVCLDIGSSTGGFTDCLLQNGASLVYAVDVGTNQLVHSLRVDDRVRVYEKTHVNALITIPFDPQPDFVVVDMSFISLSKVLPYIIEVLFDRAILLMLIKPQFELDPEYIVAGGVLKDPDSADLAIDKVRACMKKIGIIEKGLTPSRLKGKKSENQEFFIWGVIE